MGFPEGPAPLLILDVWLPKHKEIVSTWGLLLSIVTPGSGLPLRSGPSHPSHTIRCC